MAGTWLGHRCTVIYLGTDAGKQTPSQSCGVMSSTYLK